MIDSFNLDLTLPKLANGARAQPWDLRALIYKGASAENRNYVAKKLGEGEFGNPIPQRIPLVKEIHNEINALLVGGKSQTTIRTTISNIRYFFKWADEHDIELTITTVDIAYRLWSDYLLSSVRNKKLSPASAYSKAAPVSIVLTSILDTNKPLISTTNLLPGSKRKKPIATDKEDLESVIKLCSLLMDVVESLSTKAIFGPLPAKIQLRSGEYWEEWSGMIPTNKVKSLSPNFQGKKSAATAVARKRKALENNRSLQTRYPLINLRLEAELLIFITQTGMNLSQAHKLKISQANYTASIEGYQVRSYKNRKGGEVLFEIYSSYRPHFERYLSWKKEVYGDTSDLLFPFIDQYKLSSTAPGFCRIRDICKKMDYQYHGPRVLRNTRINWMLSRSRDPDLTADQAQHSKQTLLKIYEQPSYQTSKVEIIQFWRKTDPTLQQNMVGASPSPGICDGNPEPLRNMPSEAPQPDCTNPGGCLFCKHHRDIDSQDYVWSVTSMKFLHGLIVSKYRPARKNTTDTASHVVKVLEVLVAKLKWYESSNEKRKKWVVEAFDRCNEGDFHPHWSYLIESVGT